MTDKDSHPRLSSRPPGAGVAPALLALAVVALLTACSSVGEMPGAVGSPGASDQQHSHLLTVELTPSDTPEGIVEEYGGELLVWADGVFAVVGLASAPSTQLGSTFNLLRAKGATAEANSRVSGGTNAIAMQGTSGLWAGGTSGLWAGGTSSLWAGGTSRIWAGGTSFLWAGGTSYLWAGGEDAEFTWMPENSEMWRHIGLRDAHDKVADSMGLGVRIAVIDTGLDLDHPAFSEAVAGGYDFVDDDVTAQEEGSDHDAGYGHGTNVAGIVRQVAPAATIIPLRVLEPDGTGEAGDLARAIVWAVDEGDADIINLSLGAANHIRAVEAALRYAVANGVFVVASTGDSGTSEVTYPASEAATGPKAAFLLSLTSVSLEDAKSDFAPYHARKVELAAPGEFVYGPAPELRQAAWSGTSMSAPMAAGALALALGSERLVVPRHDLANALLAHSTAIDTLNDEQYRRRLGSGRLNIADFLDAVLEPTGG